MLAAEAAVIAALAALMADDDAASAADEAASVAADAAEAALSADEVADIDEDAEAASAAGGVVVVSVGLLQAARATEATREANRSDFFMNILEENLVRTITGNFGYPPSQQALLAKDIRPSSSVSCA